MKRIISMLLKHFGYQIKKLKQDQFFEELNSDFFKKNTVIDIEKIASNAHYIPGMINDKTGQFLFSLCYMQHVRGDVVEIGSWQGRSASFLARAVKASQNGKFFAVDHFKGNKGKEDYYKVQGSLSSLKDNFIKNIKKIGLSDCIELLDMPNDEASKLIPDSTVRFLFIDGDHSKEGVKKDAELFLPKLLPGSIIVFDDVASEHPGLIEYLNEFLNKISVTRVFYFENTLIVQI